MNRAPKTAGLILDSPGTARTRVETAPLTPESKEAYINRELSWLHFTRRVMALAEDGTVPLLERVKFAGIMGMLYDEFAMKRIGGLRRRIERKNTRLSPDGRTPREELQLCREELKRQTKILCRVVEKEIRPALAEAGIALKNYDQLNADERAWLDAYFRNSVQPILTPLAVDVGHPFPFISNLGLSLAVAVSPRGGPSPIHSDQSAAQPAPLGAPAERRIRSPGTGHRPASELVVPQRHSLGFGTAFALPAAPRTIRGTGCRWAKRSWTSPLAASSAWLAPSSPPANSPASSGSRSAATCRKNSNHGWPKTSRPVPPTSFPWTVPWR